MGDSSDPGSSAAIAYHGSSGAPASCSSPARRLRARNTPIELLRYLQVLRRRWLLVALTILGVLGAAFLVTPLDPTYTSTATLFVGTPPTDLRPTSGQISGDRFTGLSFLAVTFTEMIDSVPVATDAIERTGLPLSVDDVLDAVDVENPPSTQLIEVTAADDDPTVAQSLANAMALGFIDLIEAQEREQQQSTGEEDLTLTPVSLFAEAQLPTEPLASELVRNMLLALLFGTLFAAGLVLLLEYLDLTIRGPEDAERRIGLPVLGVIPLSRDTVVTPGVRPRLPGERAVKSGGRRG